MNPLASVCVIQNLVTVRPITGGLPAVTVNVLAGQGPAGPPGAAGATGSAGPNLVNGSTGTTFTGLLYGDGTKFAQLGIGTGLSISGNNLNATGSGSGTVTSVGLSMPSIFNVSNSPVTVAGTLTAALANQNANLIFAGPASGGAAGPAFRSLVAADMPATGVVSGSYGGSTAVPVITFDGNGHATSASSATYLGSALGGTSLASGITTTSITTTGALSSGSAVNGFTVADACLSSNIPRLNAANAFTVGGQTIASAAAASIPVSLKGATSTATVSNKALTSNVATLTTSAAHGFIAGRTVVVAGVDATFNGTWVISGVTSTTFNYSVTAGNVTSQAATGTATGDIQTSDLLKATDGNGGSLFGVYPSGASYFRKVGGVAGSDEITILCQNNGTQSGIITFGNAVANNAGTFIYNTSVNAFYFGNVGQGSTAASLQATYFTDKQGYGLYGIYGSSNGALLGNASQVSWSSNAFFNGTIDTKLTRASAGILSIQDPTTTGGSGVAGVLFNTQTTTTQRNVGQIKSLWSGAGTDSSALGSMVFSVVGYPTSFASQTALTITATAGGTPTVQVNGTLSLSNALANTNLGTVTKKVITCTIGNGTSVPTVGAQAFVYVPYAGTITRATLMSPISGSAVIDVWKAAYASFPPTVANTITASALPTLSSATKYQDSTLTGWTTAVSAGDVIMFNLNSVATCTMLVLELEITLS